MAHPWAADLVTTGLVLLLIDTLVPVTEHVASLGSNGVFPWLVAVLGFLALRLLVAGIYAVMRLLVERVLVRPRPTR